MFRYGNKIWILACHSLANNNILILPIVIEMRRTMKKSLFSKLTYTYTSIIFIIFFIYCLNVMDKDGGIAYQKHKASLHVFFVIFLTAFILLGINLISTKDKTDIIQKKTWMSGLKLTCILLIFLVLRALLER